MTTTERKRMFADACTITGVQDAMIYLYHDLDVSACGQHKRRSRNAVLRYATLRLLTMGFDESQARQILRQARDVYELQVAAQ
jgi:hypothetical protein